jgi:hypothetical protein
MMWMLSVIRHLAILSVLGAASATSQELLEFHVPSLSTLGNTRFDMFETEVVPAAVSQAIVDDGQPSGATIDVAVYASTTVRFSAKYSSSSFKESMLFRGMDCACACTTHDNGVTNEYYSNCDGGQPLNPRPWYCNVTLVEGNTTEDGTGTYYTLFITQALANTSALKEQGTKGAAAWSDVVEMDSIAAQDGEKVFYYIYNLAGGSAWFVYGQGFLHGIIDSVTDSMIAVVEVPGRSLTNGIAAAAASNLDTALGVPASTFAGAVVDIPLSPSPPPPSPPPPAPPPGNTNDPNATYGLATEVVFQGVDLDETTIAELDVAVSTAVLAALPTSQQAGATVVSTLHYHTNVRRRLRVALIECVARAREGATPTPLPLHRRRSSRTMRPLTRLICNTLF